MELNPLKPPQGFHEPECASPDSLPLTRFTLRRRVPEERPCVGARQSRQAGGFNPVSPTARGARVRSAGEENHGRVGATALGYRYQSLSALWIAVAAAHALVASAWPIAAAPRRSNSDHSRPRHIINASCRCSPKPSSTRLLRSPFGVRTWMIESLKKMCFDVLLGSANGTTSVRASTSPGDLTSLRSHHNMPGRKQSP